MIVFAYCFFSFSCLCLCFPFSCLVFSIYCVCCVFSLGHSLKCLCTHLPNGSNRSFPGKSIPPPFCFCISVFLQNILVTFSLKCGTQMHRKTLKETVSPQTKLVGETETVSLSSDKSIPSSSACCAISHLYTKKSKLVHPAIFHITELVANKEFAGPSLA